MKTVEAPVDAKKRLFAFLDAFHNAPNDADIEISLGMSEDQKPALLVSINGAGHILFVTEARKVAEIMEGAMTAHPNDPEGKTLANIIMDLRAACDKSDAGFAHT